VRDNDLSATPSIAVSVTAPAPAKGQRPSRGRLKCNIDASFSQSLNRTGIGMCVRDDEGTFVLAKAMNFAAVHAVDVGEALGLYHALEWLSSNLIMSTLKWTVEQHRWLFTRARMMFLSSVILLKHVVTFFPQDSQTLEWSLFGDKQMRLLMSWQEMPNY
jgi:hypothetical protein